MSIQLKLNQAAGLLAVCGVLAANAYAEGGDGPVLVSLKPLGARHSPVEPLSMVLTIRNTSADQTFSVKGAVVNYPIALASVLSGAGPVWEKEVKRDLEPQKVIEQLVTIPLGRPPLLWNDADWLFLAAGDYTFRATVVYSDEAGSEADRSIEVPISFNAPFSALVIGALVGALLIGVLRSWLAMLRKQNAGALTFGDCYRQVLVLLTLALPVSLLTALLAIILARISTEFNGVLQIELNDFWAGLIVGLLAQSTTGPVAEALGRVVGESSEKEEPSAAHAGARPGDAHASS